MKGAWDGARDPWDVCRTLLLYQQELIPMRGELMTMTICPDGNRLSATTRQRIGWAQSNVSDAVDALEKAVASLTADEAPREEQPHE